MTRIFFLKNCLFWWLYDHLYQTGFNYTRETVDKLGYFSFLGFALFSESSMSVFKVDTFHVVMLDCTMLANIFPLLSHSNKWSPLFDTVIVSGVTKCNTQQCFASMYNAVGCDIVSMVYFCKIQCYSDLDYIAVECNPLSSANHTRILIHGLANVGQN